MRDHQGRQSLTDRLREKREDGLPGGEKLKQGEIGAKLSPPVRQATVSQYEREPHRLVSYGPDYARQFFTAYGFAPHEVEELVRELFAEQIRALKPAAWETAVLVAGSREVNVYLAGTGPAWGDDEVVAKVVLPGLPHPEAKYIGLRATGDSMAPYLHRGDVAVILRDEGAVEPGDFVGVWLADDGCVIKRFVKELPDGLLLLESLNPSGDTERFFTAPLGSRILGKVTRRVLDG